MIKSNSEVALLAAIHDELLDHCRGHSERRRELSQVVDKAELNRLVDLRELLE